MDNAEYEANHLAEQVRTTKLWRLAALEQLMLNRRLFSNMYDLTLQDRARKVNAEALALLAELYP
jgi:hypothetical protein